MRTFRVVAALMLLIVVTGCADKKVAVLYWKMYATPPTATNPEPPSLDCTGASVSPKGDVTMGAGACFKTNGEFAFGHFTPGVSALDAWLRGFGVAMQGVQAAATFGAAAIIADAVKGGIKVSGQVTSQGTVDIGNVPNLNVNQVPPVSGTLNLVGPMAP